MRLSLLFLYALAVAALSGCAALAPSDFAATKPQFDPVAFFTGTTKSSGVVENRAGSPRQRVETATRGRLSGDILELEQDLSFSDGKRQHRSWRIRRIDAHHYEATANDMVGSARGEAYGNAFRWSFRLALSPGNPFGNVGMTQWMYLQPGGETMINHTIIRKYGIIVAQVTEQFRRQ